MAAHGNNTAAPGTSQRGLTRRGTMPPPPPVTASATQSLFSSLLQPPPSKRARTIHNPQDPPVPPPSKAVPATPPRKSATKAQRAAASSAAASKSKGRKDTKGKRRETGNAAGSSSRLITPQSTLGSEGFADNEDDMKAAATLTSLLLSRPSMSGSASSPRSSLSAGSDGGSSHSFSHYAQSSTRTTAPSSLPQSNEPSFNAAYTRSRTPQPESRHARTQSLPHLGNLQGSGNTTPKAQVRAGSSRLMGSNTPHPPSDTEAADLMLFLATSPSPVRASTSKDREARDMAAFRTLSGNSALKGRVLFPTAGPANEDTAPSGSNPLRRDATGSFSSVLTVATDLIDDPADDGSQEHVVGVASQSSPLNPGNAKRSRSSSMHLNVPAPPTIIPPTPTEENPVQLLPLPPSSPTPAPRPRAEPLERSASAPVPILAPSAPPTPGNAVPFNFNDFINVSPSPAATGPAAKLTSLRANVGRKLFEEHQTLGGGAHGGNDSMPGHGGPGGLGAGIDLVRSSV